MVQQPDPQIEYMKVEIVDYSTFRRWITDGVTPKKAPNRGRPRKTTKKIIDLLNRQLLVIHNAGL